jgi:23S rRNA (uridine2552-2'-O)-methyltransferase
VRDRAVVERIRAAAGRRADVVLSDLAPKLSGVRAADQARCAELVDAVLDALPILVRPGGSLLMKLFMGESHAATVARLEEAFARVRVTRPAATRLGSAELYAVGHEYVSR